MLGWGVTRWATDTLTTGDWGADLRPELAPTRDSQWTLGNCTVENGVLTFAQTAIEVATAEGQNKTEFNVGDSYDSSYKVDSNPASKDLFYSQTGFTPTTAIVNVVGKHSRTDTCTIEDGKIRFSIPAGNETNVVVSGISVKQSRT